MNVNVTNQPSRVQTLVNDRRGNLPQAPGLTGPAAIEPNTKLNAAPNASILSQANVTPTVLTNGPIVAAAPTNLLAEPPPTGNDVAHTNGNDTGHALTLDGLVKAWGTTSAEYDFTRDGTVDVKDLLAFVAKQQAAEPDPEAAALTQEGFAKAWGTDDERYDLTKDGTVDVRDLLTFLEGLDPQARVTVDPTLAATVAGSPTADDGEVTIAGLMKAWGSDAPGYDVTDDGRVDVSDLLSVLAESAPEAPVIAQPESLPSPTAEAVRPSTQAEVASTPTVPPTATVNMPTRTNPEGTMIVDQGSAGDVDGVAKLWGTGDARFDYNDDGTVDVDDLLAALAARAEADRPTAQPESLNERRSPTSAIHNILNRLANAGFAQRPPVNLHELLGEAGIQGSERSNVLDAISKHYPNGLGVNFRA